METIGVTPRIEHYHVHYIRTTAERLWRALTEPHETARYYHGLEVESDFTVGSEIRYWRTDEDGNRSVVLSGTVLECEAGTRLVHTFCFVDAGEPESRVTFELEPLGEVVKLTVLHDQLDGSPETYQTTREGWAPIFSGLKTYLETGQPLPYTYVHRAAE